jgi:hypothetical protein
MTSQRVVAELVPVTSIIMALRRHIIEIAGTSPAMTRLYVLLIQNDQKPHQDQTFTRPAAFIASPIWASPLSMKEANSPASPHIEPKPRLAMKSLNSLAS